MYGAVHNATVPIELKNAQYAGLLDPGTYKVSVKMSDKAKECITSMRIFGNEKDINEDCYTDEGCTRVLHPVTEPEIEFQFSSDPECMRDMIVYITIVPVTTDKTKLDDKMAFQIGLRPLTVSFEDLVRIVTYPNYRNIEDSESLRNEVLTLIALDVQNLITDWKKVVIPEDGKAGEFQIKVVGTTLHLEHIPKNGNEPDWWIEFPHGISVWVKDAEDAKEKISERCDIPVDVLDNFAGTDLITRCAYVCDPIKETIDKTYGAGAYNNYLLTVKFGGSECEGLSGYGAKAELVMKKYTWAHAMGYAATCYVTTIGCEVITNVATGGFKSALFAKASIGELIGCAVAPAIMYFQRESLFAEHPAATWAGSALAGTLVATSAETYKLYRSLGPIFRGQAQVPSVAIKEVVHTLNVKDGYEDVFNNTAAKVLRYLKCAKGVINCQFEGVADYYSKYYAENQLKKLVGEDKASELLRLPESDVRELTTKSKIIKDTTIEVLKKTNQDAVEEITKTVPKLKEGWLDDTLDTLKSARSRYQKYNEIAEKLGLKSADEVIADILPETKLDPKVKEAVFDYLTGKINETQLKEVLGTTIKPDQVDEVDNILKSITKIDDQLSTILKQSKKFGAGMLCGALGQVTATITTYAAMGAELQPALTVDIGKITQTTNISVSKKYVEVHP